MKFKKLLRIATFALLLAITVPASSATIVPESSGTAKTEDTRGQQLVSFRKRAYIRKCAKALLASAIR